MQLLAAIFCVCFAVGLAAVLSGCGRDLGGETASQPAPVKAASQAAAPVVSASAPSSPAPAGRVVFDSNKDSHQVWKTYSRDGRDAVRIRFKIYQENDPALIEVMSLTGGPVGVNMAVQGLKGEVAFDYKIFEAGPDAKFGLFALPIRKSAEIAPIEVGSDIPGDPKNFESKFRKRFLVPSSHNDGQWHAHQLSFDFTGLPDAGYTIIAPRVNEMPGAGTAGRIQFRNVRVVLQ